MKGSGRCARLCPWRGVSACAAGAWVTGAACVSRSGLRVCAGRGACVGACYRAVCLRVSVPAGRACLRLRKSLFPCLYARLSAKPVPGERLSCVFRGCPRVCVYVRVCGAGGRRPVHPPGLAGERRSGALRARCRRCRGAAGCGSLSAGSPAGGRGASAAAMEPGLHPPSQPAGAGGGREPQLSPAPCEVGGPLSRLPKAPPSPSGLRSWRKAALAAACSLRALPGCFRPATFLPSPRTALQAGMASGMLAGRDRSPQDPGEAVGDPRGGRMGAAALGRL